jgi:AcrR family transcriptional regulator
MADGLTKGNVTKPKRARTLDADLIVSTGIELAEREGVAALSMRRLGEELGVNATAFYRHFRDKDDLVLAIGDRVTAWTLDRVRAAITPDTPWQEVLRTIAAHTMEASRTFPAVYSMTFARTTGQAGEREAVELLLSTISRAGLSPEQTVLTYRTFADTCLALAGSNGTVGSMDPKLREKDSTAWSRIYAVLPHETYPATRRHTRELIDVTDEQIFNNAVELMIAGIEALAATGPAPAKA